MIHDTGDECLQCLAQRAFFEIVDALLNNLAPMLKLIVELEGLDVYEGGKNEGGERHVGNVGNVLGSGGHLKPTINFWTVNFFHRVPRHPKKTTPRQMSATYLRGDCLEVMKTLPDKSVDCFICDLPYGCLTNAPAKGKGVLRLAAQTWDAKIDLSAFWDQVERLMRNDSVPILHFCNTKFGFDLMESKKTWFRYDLVWAKERGVSWLLANKQPLRAHEMILVFSKRQPFFHRIDIDGLCAKSVIHQRHQKIAGHPTEKPPALYRWLLERYCPAGGTVLDPTAGSFNSITTAEELGLNGIGIEITEDFFLRAVERSVAEKKSPTTAEKCPAIEITPSLSSRE